MERAGYLALTLLLAGRAAPSQEQAGLQGIVLHALSGEPLAKVEVHVLKRDQTGLTSAYGAVTDGSGHFSIAPINPGAYYLRPERAGFVLTAPREPAAPPIPVVEIKAGQVVDYRLQMSPRALIAGRVTDDTGDPLRQVTVHAESASGNDALLTFLLAGRGSTDDRGSYRISVPPGRYRIRADIENFPSEEPDEIRTDGTTAAVFPATWFPQAKSAAAVGTVEAVAGRELGGTDIHMVRPVVLTISGIVSGIPASARASVKFNALVHHGNTIYDIDTGADGSFSRTGLEPGTYYLYAETKAPDLRSAVVELNLSDTPIVNLELALRPAAALTGTLEAPPGTNTASLRVRLEPLTDDISGSRSAAVNADGTFEIKSVAPGRYQLTVRPMAEDIYLKTVRVDNADAPHGVLDLRRGAGGSVLKITASRGAARIDGRMQGKPAVSWYGAIVFLIGDGLDPNEGPDAIDPRTDPMGGYRSIGANGDGTFSFGSVPPGKYRLYALDTGSANRPQSPEAMSAAMAHLEAIEVKEGEHVTKDLKPLGSEGSDAGK